MRRAVQTAASGRRRRCSRRQARAVPSRSRPCARLRKTASASVASSLLRRRLMRRPRIDRWWAYRGRRRAGRRPAAGAGPCPTTCSPAGAMARAVCQRASATSRPGRWAWLVGQGCRAPWARPTHAIRRVCDATGASDGRRDERQTKLSSAGEHIRVEVHVEAIGPSDRPAAPRDQPVDLRARQRISRHRRVAHREHAVAAVVRIGSPVVRRAVSRAEDSMHVAL